MKQYSEQLRELQGAKMTMKEVLRVHVQQSSRRSAVHCSDDTGATQEALTEQYNDQLRELREAGLGEQAEEVREALRALRDEERAPESSVKV